MRTLTAAAIAVLVLAGGLTPVNAEPRGHGWGHGHYNQWAKPYQNPWGSFWGGVVGGWLGSQLNRERPAADAPDEALEPWSREWYAFCSRRYRSFNPDDGTYLAFDGERRFCR